MLIGSGFSQKGAKRLENQDNYYIDNDKGIFIVADGMGGHKAGGVASQIAVVTLYNKLSELNADYEKGIKEAFAFANREIYEKSIADEELKGMGTTAVACIAMNNSIYIAHIGDSRAYLIRKKSISRLTIDHSVVEELLKKGKITESEAKNHPMKNVITDALGVEEKAITDIKVIKLNKNDAILLCTDGLSNSLSTEQILKICISNNEDDVPKQLAGAAAVGGSTDDISAVYIICKGDVVK